MNQQDFDVILQARLKKISQVLGSKAKEYAHGGDRLHNFKIAARVNGATPAQALWGMATKHFVSVMDLVAGKLEPTPEMVNEKIGDLINYLILLESIFLEADNG